MLVVYKSHYQIKIMNIVQRQGVFIREKKLLHMRDYLLCFCHVIVYEHSLKKESKETNEDSAYFCLVKKHIFVHTQTNYFSDRYIISLTKKILFDFKAVN
jgi:hypothetical protein